MKRLQITGQQEQRLYCTTPEPQDKGRFDDVRDKAHKGYVATLSGGLIGVGGLTGAVSAYAATHVEKIRDIAEVALQVSGTAGVAGFAVAAAGYHAKQRAEQEFVRRDSVAN